MSFPSLLSQKLLQKAANLKIRPIDIDEQFVRGSGAGGQKINKTSNCVFLLHRPTGFIVKCQRFRERERNRAEAYKRLINKIENQLLGSESERAQQIYKIRKQKQKRSRRSKNKMLEGKKRRAAIKQLRGPVKP